eukprot:scpid19770/ scgid9542/ 
MNFPPSFQFLPRSCRRSCGDQPARHICIFLDSAVFSQPQVRLDWKALTNVSIKTYSKTRWWSKYEVMDQLLNLFGDVVGFLRTDVETPGALRRRMHAVIENLECRVELQIQLAVTVEFCCPFVQATYKLEGDGALRLVAYEVISGIRTFVAMQPIHLPLTEAVAAQLGGAANPNHREIWMDTARQCLPPAITYFNACFLCGWCSS